jgi:GST-like protein
MSYTLYGDPGSGSFSAEALLAEVSARYTVVPVNLERNEQLTDEFKKVNPLGRIPALVLPEGIVITESIAIVLTLGELHPEHELLPSQGSHRRAELYRWLAFTGGGIYEAVSRYDYPERFTTDPAGAPAVREAAREDARRRWQIVESSLSPAPWALGEDFSVLDVYLTNLVQWIVGAGWRREHLPKLQALSDKVAARPRIAPVWHAHFGAGRASAS